MTSLANGGSLNDISYGVNYFASLKKAGTFSSAKASANLVTAGTIGVVFDWSYNQLAVRRGRQEGRADLEDVHPAGDQPDLLLQPGHQQGRPPPGRGQALGGVPLHGGCAEPLDEGRRAADPVLGHEGGRAR